MTCSENENLFTFTAFGIVNNFLLGYLISLWIFKLSLEQKIILLGIRRASNAENFANIMVRLFKRPCEILKAWMDQTIFFIPAKKAIQCVFHKIFAKIGSNDNMEIN